MNATTTNELTEPQSRVLEYLRTYIGTYGYGPTNREIATQFGFASPAGAACHLQALRRKGAITWQEGRARTIQIVKVPDA